MHKEIERRFLGDPLFRMDGDDAQKIQGYAAVFNSLSEDLGGFREVIAPGAFSDTLGADVRALWNHDANFVLGRTKSGTLRLAEDDHGLRVEIDPPESAAWIMDSMKRGDVDQMSFGFRVVSDDWRMDGQQVIRTLNKVSLFDVSVVTYPAYPATDAAVRGLREFQAAQQPPSLNLERAKLRLSGVRL